MHSLGYFTIPQAEYHLTPLTTSPTQKLEVNGNIKATDLLHGEHNSTSEIWWKLSKTDKGVKVMVWNN